MLSLQSYFMYPAFKIDGKLLFSRQYSYTIHLLFVFKMILELPAQVFSYEFCKILKNTYFVEHLRTYYSFFDNCVPGKKVFPLIFTKQVEKVCI